MVENPGLLFKVLELIGLEIIGKDKVFIKKMIDQLMRKVSLIDQ
jgi:hypothetical protein